MTWDSESQADWPVAELLATLSLESYSSPLAAEEAFHSLGFDRIATVATGCQSGYIVSVDDATVVVFRGTDDLADWFTNLDVHSCSTVHGAFHRGFYNAYESLKSQIVDPLTEASPANLWITGHSLGGALAVVCAYDLIDNHTLDVRGVITFGQPMIARNTAADYLDELLEGRYVRFVNGRDIVTRIPPQHTHCGSLVRFKGDGIQRNKAKHLLVGAADQDEATLVDDEPAPLTEEEFREAQSEVRAESGTGERYSDGPHVVKGDIPIFRDHSMALYLDKVRTLLGEAGRP
jgi:hypothetical protein